MKTNTVSVRTTNNEHKTVDLFFPKHILASDYLYYAQSKLSIHIANGWKVGAILRTNSQNKQVILWRKKQ